MEEVRPGFTLPLRYRKFGALESISIHKAALHAIRTPRESYLSSIDLGLSEVHDFIET